MRFTEYIFEPHHVEARMPVVTERSLKLVESLDDEGILPIALDVEQDMMRVYQPRLWDAANRLGFTLGIDMVKDWLDGESSISHWIAGLSSDDLRDFTKINALGVSEEVHRGFIIGNLVASERMGTSSNSAGSQPDISQETSDIFKDPIAIQNMIAAIKIRTPRYTWRLAGAIDYGLGIEFPNEDYAEAAKLGALACYSMRTFEVVKKRERLQFDHEWHERETENALIAAAMAPEADRGPFETADRMYTERHQDLESLYAQPSYVRHFRFLQHFPRRRRK